MTPARRIAVGIALATLAFLVLAVFGGELLDPLGIPGIWFPFGIWVSRTQYLYAIFIPVLAFLITRCAPARTQRPRYTASALP